MQKKARDLKKMQNNNITIPDFQPKSLYKVRK
jgi:hypothetical protein